MTLNDIDFTKLKKIDPENGYLSQLSYDNKDGWKIVGLSFFQRQFLRRLRACCTTQNLKSNHPENFRIFLF